MIEEAPMWLLLPLAALAWLLYAGVVLAERRENREVDRQAQRDEAHRRADQPADDEPKHLVRHARSVAQLTDLPPGIPSVAERLDRWSEIA